MFKYIYRRLLIGYMLVTEPFKKMERKNLQEKIFHPLHAEKPVFILHQGVYYILLNNWLGTELLIERLEISIAAQPDGQFQEIPFRQEDGFLKLDIPAEKERVFVKLNFQDSEIIIGERLLDMQGTVNFRDIGGFSTSEGKQVAWNKIFRSGHLNKLSKKEKDYFVSLGIKTIIDFRGHSMTKRFPDKVPNASEVEFISLPIESKGLEMRKVGLKILNDNLGDFDARSILNQSYTDFIIDAKKEARTVLDAFHDTDGNILIHCTAGKDRTGFFIALLLRILGVPLDIIRKDFIASNFYRKKESDRLYQNAAAFTNADPLLPLINVQDEYLETAFRVMEEEYGTLENYLKEALNIDEKYIQELKDKYLIEA